MAAIEPACFAIAALWLALRLVAERDRRGLVLRLLVVAAASWMGEESCIRLYGFYGYAKLWQLRLLDVPLAVVCIWPIVVQSALDLTRAVRTPRRALVAAALVTVDASLIEPISTRIGLWTWFHAGPFSVPVVGVLGWGCFALGVALVIERRPLWALVVAPAVTHLCLLAAWWGALRWLPPGEGELPWIALAALGSCAAAVLLWRRPPPVLVRDVWLRAPAAGFFFALLALFARDDLLLVAWALAFAPPWLVLLARRRAETSRGAS
ncbi:MAG: carotenoid biosynthesis protein [Deltaproteobacteria bacterium]|nr:carotenoid biosynthesis protein [Deltaproteobacteria bacterium]